MATLSKKYKIKKFSLNELSNAVKNTYFSLNFDPDEVTIRYDYVIDGINDEKELSFKELEMITSIENSDLHFSYRSSNFYTQIMLSEDVTLYGDKFLRIGVGASSADLVKKTFSILEKELLLKEISNGIIESTTSETSKDADKSNLDGVKQVKKDLTKHYSPIKLYKEDLISLINLFDENYKKCKVQIDNYKIKDKDAIENIKAKMNKDWSKTLSISGSNSYGYDINLNLSPYSAYINVNDDKDVKSLGVLYKIDTIISKRENILLKWINIHNNRYYGIIIISTVCSILIAIFGRNLFGKSISLIIAIFFAFFPIYMLLGMLFTYNRYNRIYLFNSNEKQHFLTKNRDIIVTIGGGLLVTVVGGLILAYLRII